MVWYSHLFQNFPEFVVICIVPGFGIVTKAEIDVFLELSCFFHDPADVGNLISGSSAFSKTILNIWKFTVHILLKPGLDNFEITLLAYEMSAMSDISSLSHSIVFLHFFALITEEVFLISPCYSLKLCIQMGISLSFSPLLFASLLFTAICKATSDSHFAFLPFFFFGMV